MGRNKRFEFVLMVLVVSEGIVDLSTGELGKRRNYRIHRAARPDHRDDVMHPNPSAFDGGMTGTHAGTADDVAVARRDHVVILP